MICSMLTIRTIIEHNESIAISMGHKFYWPVILHLIVSLFSACFSTEVCPFPTVRTDFFIGVCPPFIILIHKSKYHAPAAHARYFCAFYPFFNNVFQILGQLIKDVIILNGYGITEKVIVLWLIEWKPIETRTLFLNNNVVRNMIRSFEPDLSLKSSCV